MFGIVDLFGGKMQCKEHPTANALLEAAYLCHHSNEDVKTGLPVRKVQGGGALSVPNGFRVAQNSL